MSQRANINFALQPLGLEISGSGKSKAFFFVESESQMQLDAPPVRVSNMMSLTIGEWVAEANLAIEHDA